MPLLKSSTLPISNEWFRGNGYLSLGGHSAFCSYIQILKRRGLDRISIISMDILLDELNSPRSSALTKKQLLTALIFLHENKLIKFYKDFNLKKEVTDLEMNSLKLTNILYCSLPVISSDFSLLRVDEVQAILNAELKTSEKKGLLATFGCLVSHINNKSKICYPSMDLIRQEAKIGRSETCSKYIKLLVDLGLIIYDNAGVRSYITEDGSVSVHNLSNTYARPEDRELLQCSIDTLRERANFKPFSKNRKKLINEKRSITQKINNLKKTVFVEERAYTNIEAAQIKAWAYRYNSINNLLGQAEEVDAEAIIEQSEVDYTMTSELALNDSTVLIAAKSSDIRIIDKGDEIPDNYFALPPMFYDVEDLDFKKYAEVV